MKALVKTWMEKRYYFEYNALTEDYYSKKYCSLINIRMDKRSCEFLIYVRNNQEEKIY